MFNALDMPCHPNTVTLLKIIFVKIFSFFFLNFRPCRFSENGNRNQCSRRKTQIFRSSGAKSHRSCGFHSDWALSKTSTDTQSMIFLNTGWGILSHKMYKCNIFFLVYSNACPIWRPFVHGSGFFERNAIY